ncbi:hypothetical protein L1887_16804 [Cichorium endivia]|nr:hypothetical protein L1887_16804 [Cichorium endivia]
MTMRIMKKKTMSTSISRTHIPNLMMTRAIHPIPLPPREEKLSVARERACRTGDSTNGGMNCVFLENISHGQLQALSTMRRDSPALTGGDSEGSFVITTPPIMEGRGVVKRYGPDRVHVVPMHAGMQNHN